MRVLASFKLAGATSSNNSILTYKADKTLKDLMVIKIVLPDGSMETVVTNVFDNTITTTMFEELYFLRWGVESKYKELKVV